MGTTMEKLESGSVACSVCLEQVKDVGERSIAKLRCGHHFHLDCIGSAFNAKGSMQCPNCRQVEDGRWLYANGSRSQEDWSFEDFPSSYEDDYEVYAGLADMLHPHHELFGHFQWCPYQTNYPQFSVTLQEIDPPVTAYPDFIVSMLYGDEAPSQHICPYLGARQHTRRLEEQLVMEMDVPSGGPLGGGNRGERNGWPSQYAPHATSVGMMNDVGLSSLPNDRFRWPVSANRSDAPQPGYVGQERNSEATTVGSSWHEPCPQHGFGGSSHPYAQLSTAPATTPHHSSVRRHRRRGFASSSSSRNDTARQQQPPGRATWGTGTAGSLDTRAATHRELSSGQAFRPGGWQQQQPGDSNQSYQWRDSRTWGGRWYHQRSGASSTASASYHPNLVYGTGGVTAAPSAAGDGNYAAAAAARYTSFDGQDVSQLRAFMPPPR